jgi:hypothetical protein
MALTTYPSPIQKNSSVYINAGITYYGNYLTGVSGATSVLSPLPNTIGSNTSGSGYEKLVLSGNATLSWNVTSLATKYGYRWYAEIYNPASYTVTWTGVSWNGGTAPTQATTGRSVYEFWTSNAGSTIYGRLLIANAQTAN